MKPATKDEVGKTVRQEVPVEAIVRDEANREVAEDEDLGCLTDSIRVLGVLQPVHVRRRDDGTFALIDGERRWRAAKAAGLTTVPAEIWPAEGGGRDAVVVGVVLNEQRKAHGCMQVARRLRQIRNEFGDTHEEIARRTGLPIVRVKAYASLFQASDHLLALFDESDIPLFLAVELMRYERATSEAACRALTRRHHESPLTHREIVAMRRRAEAARKGSAPEAPHGARHDGFCRACRVGVPPGPRGGARGAGGRCFAARLCPFGKRACDEQPDVIRPAVRP